MTKLEQDFEIWWEREGQEFLYALNTTTDDDIKLVAEITWKNGAYCSEQAEQEPVAWMNEINGFICKEKTRSYHVPLYAAPVRTKDLTDDEIHKAFYSKNTGLINGIRAVIAADREKNK